MKSLEDKIVPLDEWRRKRGRKEHTKDPVCPEQKSGENVSSEVIDINVASLVLDMRKKMGELSDRFRIFEVEQNLEGTIKKGKEEILNSLYKDIYDFLWKLSEQWRGADNECVAGFMSEEEKYKIQKEVDLLRPQVQEMLRMIDGMRKP